MTLFQSFKAMPTILKFLTAHALVCLVFFIAAVIPGIPINVDGQEMTSSEMWATGTAMFFILPGIAMPICGWLLLRRAAYARPIYLTVVSAGLIAPSTYTHELGSALFGLAIAALIAAYLYGKSSVRAYFAANGTVQPAEAQG